MMDHRLAADANRFWHRVTKRTEPTSFTQQLTLVCLKSNEMSTVANKDYQLKRGNIWFGCVLVSTTGDGVFVTMETCISKLNNNAS